MLLCQKEGNAISSLKTPYSIINAFYLSDSLNPTVRHEEQGKLVFSGKALKFNTDNVTVEGLRVELSSRWASMHASIACIRARMCV